MGSPKFVILRGEEGVTNIFADIKKKFELQKIVDEKNNLGLKFFCGGKIY